MALSSGVSPVLSVSPVLPGLSVLPELSGLRAPEALQEPEEFEKVEHGASHKRVDTVPAAALELRRPERRRAENRPALDTLQPFEAVPQAGQKNRRTEALPVPLL